MEATRHSRGEKPVRRDLRFAAAAEPPPIGCNLKTIVIATSAAWRDLHPEDRALAACLRERHGLEVETWVWTEPRRLDPARHLVVPRSVWDYHERFAEFGGWLDALERAGVATANPVPVLRWNCDKRYLRELEARGAALPRTEWLESATTSQLGESWRSFGGRCVMKPAVSASGKATFLVTGETELEHAAATLAGRAVLVQEFMAEVRGAGEWSLVFLGGEFSHAFRKRARGEEFRVQEEHGGENIRDSAPVAALAAARDWLRLAPPGPLAYARVDGVLRDGRFILMELELLEPRLYPEMGEGVTARFARHLAALAGG